MQLGTRWTSGDQPPAAVPAVLHELRSMVSRSLSTRCAVLRAASASPTVWRKRAARLSGTSACTRGPPGASACPRSITAGSGAYSTSISAAASSAW